MKNIVITGGSRGIGAAMVEMFAKNGDNVFFSYNKSEKKANDLVKKYEGNVQTYKADLSNMDELNSFVDEAKKRFKKIDVLINNAGIDQFKLFSDINLQDWDEIINTNLRSAVFMSKEISKVMVNQKEGCIINISSVWGIAGASCEVLYSISKSGIDGLTKALAKELALSNIRVNSIAPGAIDTDMNRNVIKEEIEMEIPLGRFGKPEEIAKCAKWLVEDNYTTGQIISPNGGWII